MQDSSAQVEHEYIKRWQVRKSGHVMDDKDGSYPKSIMRAERAIWYFRPSGRGKSGVGGARPEKDHPLVPPPGSTPSPNKPKPPNVH